MERLTKALKRRGSTAHAYEPLGDDSLSSGSTLGAAAARRERFSWMEYSIFLLQGISMLWAWNMFMAAAPYFQARFSASPWLLTHFQPAILTVSTSTSACVMIVLTKAQRNASYPQRIMASLVLNMICFTLLAFSTAVFRHVAPGVYFMFLMAMVCLSAFATALCQNGLFAFVSGFGVSDYTQAIMTGQGIAGVLPCITQILSVLSVPERNTNVDIASESPQSAFIYFLTATAVSAISLLAFIWLARQHPNHSHMKTTTTDGTESPHSNESSSSSHLERKVVGMRTLFRKLRWLSLGVFTTYGVTMMFPVFTQEILSVRTPDETLPRLFKPACFIPLAFLIWNAGDLSGRIITINPKWSITHVPKLVFVLSTLRILFVPMYFLCNIRGQGAVIPSDAFYLFIVQFLFGLSSGFLGSTCMMGASEWVDPDEREAAGGFMGLSLVAGLTTGSLLSFVAAMA